MAQTNSNIRTQIGLAFALLVVLPVVLGGLSIAKLSEEHGRFAQLADVHMPAVADAYASKSHLQDAVARMGDVLLSDDPSYIQAQLDGIEADRRGTEEAMDRFSAAIALPEGQAYLQDVTVTRMAYAQGEEKFLQLVRSGDKVAAKRTLLDEVRPAELGNVKALNRLIDARWIALAGSSETSVQHYRSSRNALILYGFLVYVIGSFTAAFAGSKLRNSLGGDLGYAVEIARGIASGDLDMEVRAIYGDQSSLLATMGSMRDHLLKIVSHVSYAAASVCQGTTKLAHGNADLSQSTRDQAHALAETSATIEELTISVKKNADNARQTTQRATQVAEQAENGGAVVQRAITAMGEISASSRRITDIISVMDEIAFQTNLLALNAAVEAARAGDQGRGFAVVAGEVRMLAQRSAAAAKEVGGLITESVAKVNVGANLIDESGQTLTQIIGGVKDVANVIAEIAAATKEQAAAIDELSGSVADMDATTQKNFAFVDRAADTSKEIQRLAEELAATVALFRTGGPQPAAVTIDDIHDEPRRAPRRAVTTVSRGSRTFDAKTVVLSAA